MRLLVAVLIVSCSSSMECFDDMPIIHLKLTPVMEEFMKMLETKVETVKTGKDALIVGGKAFQQNQHYFGQLLGLVVQTAPPEAKEYMYFLNDVSGAFYHRMIMTWSWFTDMYIQKGGSMAIVNPEKGDKDMVDYHRSIKRFESIKLDEKKSAAWMAIKNKSNTLEKEISDLCKTVTGSSKLDYEVEKLKVHVPILKTVDKPSKKQEEHLLVFTLTMGRLLDHEANLASKLFGYLKKYSSEYSIELILSVYDQAKIMDHRACRSDEAIRKMKKTHKVVVEESMVKLFQRISAQIHELGELLGTVLHT